MADLLILLRYVASGLGVLAVAFGWLTKEEADALALALLTLVGSVAMVLPPVWAILKRRRDTRDADMAGALREVAASNREVVTATAAAMVAEPTQALREAAATLPGLNRLIDSATARIAEGRR